MTLLRLTCWLLAGLLAGCSSMNESIDKINPFAKTAPKIKPAELAPIEATAKLRVLWQASVGSAGEFTFTPAVVGKTVYAVAKDGTLARFDEGRQVWKIAVGQVISGGVGADARLVVLGTLKGEVIAFNAENGTTVWRTRVSSDILAAPAVANDIVLVRSGDSRIFAFDAADGKRRWVYQRSTPALTLRTNAGVTLLENAILAGFPGGKLVALSKANGAAYWEATVALPKGSTELERVADVTSSPMVDRREVCAAAYQGRVACFDVQNGNNLWARELSSRAGLDLDDRFAYVSDDKGTIHALDRSNGGNMWKQDKLSHRSLSRPITLEGHVVVGDYQGVVHVLKREDGSLAARLTTDGSPILAEPQRLADGILVQTRNGGLYAIDIE